MPKTKPPARRHPRSVTRPQLLSKKVDDETGPSNYDWTLPPEPIRLAKWVAAHRILVRIILACIDVTVLAFLIAGIVHGTNRWNSYLQPLAWALFTYNFGWGMPRTVDTWNRRQNQEQPPGSDSPAD